MTSSRKTAPKVAAGDALADEPLISQIQPDSAKRLVLEAIQLFATRGYHATTTRDISVAAGMSPAALYVYFESKEALLLYLCRIGHESALAAISHSTHGFDDAETRLWNLVRDYALWHATHTLLARVCQYELEHLTPANFAEVADLRRQMAGMMRNEIAAGVRSGSFEVEDVSTAGLALLSMGIDIARWFHADGKISAGTLSARYADLAIQMTAKVPAVGSGRAKSEARQPASRRTPPAARKA